MEGQNDTQKGKEDVGKKGTVCLAWKRDLSGGMDGWFLMSGDRTCAVNHLQRNSSHICQPVCTDSHA